MSKYLLFFALLISLTALAQESIPVNPQAIQNFRWDEQEPYVNDYARVLQSNKFSFINQAGNLICPLEFDEARNFSNHFAAVKKDNKWGFINELGQVIIPFKYEIVYDFTENVTAVYSKNLWWLINSKAEVFKVLDITVFYGFNSGVAKVNKNGRWGSMNTNGEIIFEKEPINALQNSIIPPKPNANSFANSVSICPDNIDFEFGSFQNWKCFTGRVDSIGTTNVITVTPSAPTVNRHTLYSKVLPSAIDAFGLFPTNPPDGSNFAVRLGNTKIGAEAERIRYTINVPVNDSNFSIKYDYAVVFEDPGHTTWTQPRFTVRVFDSAANTYVDCASFEYISTSNLPGFARSTVNPGVMYKPWSTVFLSLRGYAGKTMFLEFTTADCVRRGHWGYAYVDVEKPCGQSVEMQYDCTAPNITTLTGPPGFQTYNWWNQNFSTLLGTGQQVILNPGPPVNSTVWLEMIPFNNFGCTDTLAVKITGTFNADFGLSDTVGICAPHTFTFYNRNLPSTSAIWDFGDGTTGTGDTVSHTYSQFGNYIVKLNVILSSGCIGTALKTVSVLKPVGSFTFNQAYYCNSETAKFDAVVSSADSLYWDFGDGTFLRTLQTTVFHTYNAPGVYLPHLTLHAVNGCENTIPAPDTINIEKLKPGFTASPTKMCGSTIFNFTDTSYSYFGIISRKWDFGDGTTGGGKIVNHTYNVTGTYAVQLIIVGNSGCIDTIINPIFVKVNNFPVATIIGDTVQCQSTPVTFTSTILSADTVTTYNWASSNGLSGSGNSFTVTFNTPGNYKIELIVKTVNGCSDTTTHLIRINPTSDVLQSADQTLCNNNSTTAIVFTGPVTGTTYSWTNSNPSIGLGASGTGNIASFITTNSTTSASVATISVLPVANGCPGPAKTFIITVNPTPDVVQPANQILCNNNNTSTITFAGSVAGTTYNWTNDNPAIGIGANGTGNILSFNAKNNGANVLVATISVTPFINGCPGISKTFTITVNPTPDVIQSSNQVLCNGEFTSDINFSGGVTGAIYTWTNTAPSIGLAASGTGNIPSFQAFSNGTSVSNAAITVKPTFTGCLGLSKVILITVRPTANVVQPINQTLCNGSTTNAITFTGTVAGTVYNWTNSDPSIGLPASGTGDIPSFIAKSNGTSILVATITVTPVANGCPGLPKTIQISVKPTPDVLKPSDQTLCNNNNTAAITFTSSVIGTTYNWTNTYPGIGLAASGSGDIPSFIAKSNGANTDVATITVTPIVNGCPGVVKAFEITVNPTPDVLKPSDQILCNNSNTAAITFAGSVTGTTYNWINTNPSIGLPANGSGDISSFIVKNNGVNTSVATITVTPIVNGCSGVPKIFEITVKPTPDVLKPSDQALCNNSNTSAVIFAGSVTGTTYNWINTNSAIGLASSSGTGNISSFIAKSNGVNTAVAIITVTPTVNGCPGGLKTFDIIVNPISDVLQPANQTVCNGAVISTISFMGSVSGTTYTWTNNNPLIGLANSGTGDINSYTAINKTASPIAADITVTPALTSCPAPSKTFSIIINPTPAVIASNDVSVCLGSTEQLSATGAVQYIWLPVDHLSCTNCANPISKPVDSIIYTVKGTNSFGCVAFDSVLLNVIKPFKMQVLPGDTLCLGESLNLNASKAKSYLWSPAEGLDKTNTANPTAKPTVTTTYKVIGFDGHNCFTDSAYVSIIVGPKPTVNLGQNRTLATGTTLALNAVTQNGPIISWLWTPAIDLSCNNCPSPTTIVKNNSFYSVLVTNNFGCTATDTIFINSICKSAQVFIPNAFTPDGDGLNDVLIIRGKGITIKSFRVFNRWGELVFEKENFYPNDLKYGWDGKVKGVPATPDVFVYTAEVFCDNGVVYTYKGNTTILK